MTHLGFGLKWTNWISLIWNTSSSSVTFRVSLYADVVALFINTSHSDLQATNFILKIFTEASGLDTNMAKT
jgi:hypothetical protein